MGKQIILFGAEMQLDRLSKLGDPLEKIDATIDWEIFRPTIVKQIRQEEYSKGGRPPQDEILMFKITLLQDWNNTSDDSTEYMVNCRLDWQRFLGMELGEKSPDAKTIWLFKEQLGKEGLRELFDLLNEKLVSLGLVKRLVGFCVCKRGTRRENQEKISKHNTAHLRERAQKRAIDRRAERIQQRKV